MANTTTVRVGTQQGQTFPNDATGRVITQDYLGLTQTSGTMSLYTNAQILYALTPALTGNCSFTIGTASPQICDTIDIMVIGGSTGYTASISNGFASSVASVFIPANKYAKISGVYNGTAYVVSALVTI